MVGAAISPLVWSGSAAAPRWPPGTNSHLRVRHGVPPTNQARQARRDRAPVQDVLAVLDRSSARPVLHAPHAADDPSGRSGPRRWPSRCARRVHQPWRCTRRRSPVPGGFGQRGTTAPGRRGVGAWQCSGGRVVGVRASAEGARVGGSVAGWGCGFGAVTHAGPGGRASCAAAATFRTEMRGSVSRPLSGVTGGVTPAPTSCVRTRILERAPGGLQSAARLVRTSYMTFAVRRARAVALAYSSAVLGRPEECRPRRSG